MLAAETPAQLRRLGPPRARRRGPAGPARSPSAGAASRRASEPASPGVHLTPVTEDRDARRRLVRPLRGRRPRRGHRQAPRRPVRAREARLGARSSTPGPPTWPWPASGGTRTRPGRASGRSSWGSTTTPGRSTTSGVASGFAAARRRELVDELAAAARAAPSTGTRGATGRPPELGRGGVRAPDAGRPEPLEPGQGPDLGAAARRAGRRGGLRPPPGRPVPPRHPARALAARPPPGRLPVRPAGGHAAVRAGRHLRERRLDDRALVDGAAGRRVAGVGVALAVGLVGVFAASLAAGWAVAGTPRGTDGRTAGRCRVSRGATAVGRGEPGPVADSDAPPGADEQPRPRPPPRPRRRPRPPSPSPVVPKAMAARLDRALASAQEVAPAAGRPGDRDLRRTAPPGPACAGWPT